MQDKGPAYRNDTTLNWLSREAYENRQGAAILCDNTCPATATVRIFGSGDYIGRVGDNLGNRACGSTSQQ